MKVSVVSRGELTLVGLKVVGRRSELSHRVPLAWARLVASLNTISHAVHPDVLYGVFPESDHQREGDDGVYSYGVCVEVGQQGTLPDGMSAWVLPPSAYAMGTVKGDASAINATYLRLAEWVAEQGWTTDTRACCFERYEQHRQRVTPPYEHFDYDIFKPLAR